jgi:penicillin-binding protein 2B
MFPAEDPQYIIYISTKQFVGPITQVANAVKTVVEEVAKYKNIVTVSSDVDKSQIITLDSYLNTDVLETDNKLKYLKLQPIILGDGKLVINQYPLKDTKALVGTKIYLITNGTNFSLPDIKGWSESDALTVCNLLNLTYHFNGYGKVTSYTVDGNNVTIELGS